MSNVTYDHGNVTITVAGLDTVARALGELRSKTPAAAKVAINAAAREARKRMIVKAKARYAVNAKGLKHLKDLKQKRRATNSNLSATLFISKLRNDLGYFQTNPSYPTHFSGGRWRFGPDVWTGRVLKSSGMTPLPGKGDRSKAFLVKFKNQKRDGTAGGDHIGMVQRVIGSRSKHTKTKSGADRWTNSKGKVEKLVTLGSPSAAAMHRKIWLDVEPEVEEYLLDRLNLQVEKVLARAQARVQKR